MLPSQNIVIDEFIEEVGYCLGVVASKLGKDGLDKEKYQYDYYLTQSTLNQVVFLKGESLPDDISNDEYPGAVDLYHDVLESFLNDLESSDKNEKFKYDVVANYKKIIFSLNGLVGAQEHGLCDASPLFEMMYGFVSE